MSSIANTGVAQMQMQMQISEQVKVRMCQIMDCIEELDTYMATRVFTPGEFNTLMAHRGRMIDELTRLFQQVTIG